MTYATEHLVAADGTTRYQIKNRFAGAVQFECDLGAEANGRSASFRLGLAIKLAIKSGANLSGAALSRAYLSGANLSRAYLTGANLSGAYLTGANLSGAYLSGANLSGAALSRAYLSGANLSRADLTDADLTDAYLTGANLSRADLTGANLSGAYLTGANLSGAFLIDGGQRSDGYRFIGWIKGGVLMIRAGCRNFTVAEYRYHNSNRADAVLRDETTAILDHIERVAALRGMVKEPV